MTKEELLNGLERCGTILASMPITFSHMSIRNRRRIIKIGATPETAGFDMPKPKRGFDISPLCNVDYDTSVLFELETRAKELTSAAENDVELRPLVSAFDTFFSMHSRARAFFASCDVIIVFVQIIAVLGCLGLLIANNFVEGKPVGALTFQGIGAFCAIWVLVTVFYPAMQLINGVKHVSAFPADYRPNNTLMPLYVEEARYKLRLAINEQICKLKTDTTDNAETNENS